MQVRTLILGAGAAGLMCAAHAGPDVLIVDHAKNPGEKIRISGGGRCNFTNMGAGPENYLSQNPHFCKSALSRYTQWDFLDLVQRHNIAWHEKTLGQLFCDGKSTQIVEMLRAEAQAAGAKLWLHTSIIEIAHRDGKFHAVLEREGKRVTVVAEYLVLATGGKPIPKMGATDLSLRLAEQFGLGLTDTRAALVPFTFPNKRFADLAGVALPSQIVAGQVDAHMGQKAFAEALLFTHRGLSGPAVLQASSYWREGEAVTIDLDPDNKIRDGLRAARAERGRGALHKALAEFLPARVVNFLRDRDGLAAAIPEGNLADQSDAALDQMLAQLRAWQLTPSGSEGYRTAEVMLGGVDTDGLNSKTMAAKHMPNLYVIGEAADVTGWLGGYNFQWAWSSGWAAGQAISAH